MKDIANFIAGFRRLQEALVADGAGAPTERAQMIAVGAYHRAEQHGFPSGREMEDWLQAEKEVESIAAGARTEVRDDQQHNQERCGAG